jgi:hypothetical protein
MRSEQVYRAMEQGNTRYEICSLGSKGVRIMHVYGTPLEESIGKVLTLIGTHPAASLRFKPTES